MKKIPCLYAIVRFAPFVETEEFANVGIVLLAPTEQYFDFRLLDRRHARVTRFFAELKPGIFNTSMRKLREELQRVAVLLREQDRDRVLNLDTDFGRSLFAEIIRPRETIIKFSEPRSVLAADPKEQLKALYGFYVERNFATQEYQEALMERGLRGWLVEARLADRFHSERLGDETYGARFPFVEGGPDRPLKAIKPLYLGQDDPSRIIDHGGQWALRVARLRRRQRLPQELLFAVQGPEDEGRSRFEAYEEAVEELRQANVAILPFVDKQRILSFAATAWRREEG
ncbi:DUF3037 domain-containing protein [Acidithiobacillus sp. AMEEHan]|uniref:DUF3037 domain-containing protein n=1 Tax=Acidithiobacillus sp. AMEEHan TaxID=2994951 RepID=UPI0027E538BE|nr:DUF3037 domain-containing protein [Acidithiobacillus sp. AMEEHan]